MDKKTKKIAKKILDNLVINESRGIHSLWIEPKLRKKYTSFTPLIGKTQYFFTSDKGKISMIKLGGTLYKEKPKWEIYCIDGKLFEDIMRFKTQKEARKKIKELLI